MTTWNEYFESHPDFAQLTPKFWESQDGNTARMYFGDSYLQRRIEEQPRGGASYYDRHRIAKGDTMAVVSDVVTWVGGDDLLATIRLAAGECELAELWQRLIALLNRPKSRTRVKHRIKLNS